MRFSVIIPAAIAALSGSAAAVGKVHVANNCDRDLFAFSTNQDGSIHTKKAIGTYAETYRGMGIDIKISDSGKKSSLYDGTPLVNVQYTLDGNLVYYGISRTNGDLLNGGKITVTTSAARTVDSADDENRIKTVGKNKDIHVTLCA